MVINGGYKCSATTSDAPYATIMSAIRENRSVSTTNQQHNPASDDDINWLLCKNNANESIKVRASKVLEIMMFFSY